MNFGLGSVVSQLEKLNKEIVIYAPTEIEYYFLSNHIRFVRCMLYKHIKLDMKQVNRELKELAKQYENGVSI